MAAKTGMNKFFDFLKLSDPEDDFDTDLFDDEDDDDFEDDYYEEKPKKTRTRNKKTYDDLDDEEDDLFAQKQTRRKARPVSNPSNIVAINGRNRNRSSNQVYVIKPKDFNEAQSVTDYLRDGKTIVLNMEGIEVNAAQRIIDFIAGSVYAFEGSLQAISANIFIAAPSNVDVSGDLREELINESVLSPDLGMY